MSDLARVLALVQRHGWNATAFQTLESGYRYFFHGDDACVAYVDTGRAWIAAGAPIAGSDALGATARAFIAAARARGRRSAFVATERRLQLAAAPDLRSIRIGEQPVWDPSQWSTILAGRRSLREQLRRARAKGVRVRLVTAAELTAGPTHDALVRLCERWLAERGLAPLHFLVRVEPYSFARERRCFVAECKGRVVGFAGVVPVPARGGWFLEDLVRERDAPNGTTELLVDATMRGAASAGSRWLTLGTVPLSGEIAAPLRVARCALGRFYNFAGLRAFRAKLGPCEWTPIYLAHPPDEGTLAALFDGLSAFTGGGVPRYAVRSLLRSVRAREARWSREPVGM